MPVHRSALTTARPWTALLLLAAAAAPGSGCCPLRGTLAADAPPVDATAATSAPTVTAADAAAFMTRFEAERRRLLAERERADWIRSTHITADTQLLAERAEVALMAFMTESVDEARAFADLPLDGALARKMKLLRLSQTIAAPADPAARTRLAELSSAMVSRYGKGAVCDADGANCQSLGQLSGTMASSRDADTLLETWLGWRETSAPARAEFPEYVAIANQGARELGFPDAGAMWRSKYDMPPDAFAVEMDRLWEQVRPLYEQLHCYVRGQLSNHYGAEIVDPSSAIPAHLLGNMWAQAWSNLDTLVVPPELRQGDGGSPVTAALVDKGVDPVAMTRMAEGFFDSLGLGKLPETFWERSMFTKPADRDVVCHASAWPVDWYDDLRIKMCIEITEDDLVTLHHELGHLYYYDAYKDQSTLFTESAHDGFHEALGDTIALSVTPKYLETVGLVEPREWPDIEQLLRRALDKVAFLPFGLLVDKWRWQVFSGQTGPDSYNAAWWSLRLQYQGVAPPVARSEADFDPAAKYHIAGSVPYARYFLAHVLQFQLHRALCRIAGQEGPLHRCSIHGSEEAGARLRAMMAMGMSQPWPDALEALTGERQMDGTALLEYFAPLMTWLEARNKEAGHICGW